MERKISEYEFYLKEASIITGVTIPRLEEWLKLGYVSPSVQKASGRGVRNIFNMQDLFLIALLDYLISTGKYRKFAKELTLKIKSEMLSKLFLEIEATYPLMRTWVYFYNSHGLGYDEYDDNDLNRFRKKLPWNPTPIDIAKFVNEDLFLNTIYGLGDERIYLCFDFYSFDEKSRNNDSAVLCQLCIGREEIGRFFDEPSLADEILFINCLTLTNRIFHRLTWNYPEEISKRLYQEILIYFGHDRIAQFEKEQKISLEKAYGFKKRQYKKAR